MTPLSPPAAQGTVTLPELPRPSVCYADHSYQAFSAKQMQEYALLALASPSPEALPASGVDVGKAVAAGLQNLREHDQPGQSLDTRVARAIRAAIAALISAPAPEDR